jgi:hypothetical protein
MLSAPVSIPATIEAIFNPAFAPADSGARTRSSASWCRPTRSASRITGTTHADATRFGSSNTASTRAAL